MLDVLSVYIFPPFNINLQVQKSMIPAVKLEMARIFKNILELSPSDGVIVSSQEWVIYLKNNMATIFLISSIIF